MHGNHRASHQGRRVLARITRRALAPLTAGLVLLGACGTALGADEELPSGRLGYKWTPDPPKQPMSRESQIALNVVKYGGGAVVGIWFLRKLASRE